MKIAFRSDASPAIGAGHVMRCLSLADGLRSAGAEVCFVSRALPAHLADLLTAHGHEVLLIDGAPDDRVPQDLAHSSWLGTTQAADAEQSAEVLAGRGCAWLVVDHYALDTRWESTMRASASRVLVVDDLADRPHDCDVLLDQNAHADPERRYAGRLPPHAERLLGPRFALLRGEFRHARLQAPARTGAVRRVLVSFGGADAANDTAAAIDAVHAARPETQDVDVVIGAGHGHREDVEAACLRHGYRCHVQSDRMAELMAGADLAIGAGGVTTWERCCVGLPALVAAVALNQVELVADAARLGLVYAIDGRVTASRLALHLRALADNPSVLRHLSRQGLDAVDGLGVDRTMEAMGLDAIRLREAVPADTRPLFEWRNHESVRRMSRHPGPVTWVEHEAWVALVIADANRVLLIGEHGGQPVGVVRFDLGTGEAEVSIYRVPTSTERGLGSRLLRAAEAWLKARRPDVTRLTAEVLGENERSHRLFRSAGYHARSVMYEKRLHA